MIATLEKQIQYISSASVLDTRILQKFGSEVARSIIEQQMMAKKYEEMIQYFHRNKERITGEAYRGKRSDSLAETSGVVSNVEEKINNSLVKY